MGYNFEWLNENDGSEEIAKAIQHAVSKYFKDRFPYASKYEYNDVELEQLTKELKRWYVAIKIMTLSYIIIAMFAYSYVVQIILKIIFNYSYGYSCILVINGFMSFCLPCIFLAIGTVFQPLEWLQKKLMGSKYEIFNDLHDDMKGYDGRKAAIVTYKIFIFIFFIVLIPFVPPLVIVKYNEIKTRHNYEYKYKKHTSENIFYVDYFKNFVDAENVANKSVYFKVVFKDTTTLNSLDWEVENETLIYNFLKTISQKGVFIDTIETDTSHYHYAYLHSNNSQIINADSLKEQLEKIITKNTKVIYINASDTDAYFERGNAKSKLKDYQGAIFDFSKIIEIAPKCYWAYKMRGIAKAQLCDYQAALTDYNTALNINPNCLYAYFYRGLAKKELSDFIGALSDFNRVLELKSNDTDSYFERAKTKEELNDIQGAIDDFSKILKFNPKNTLVYHELGQVKEKPAIQRLNNLF